MIKKRVRCKIRRSNWAIPEKIQTAGGGWGYEIPEVSKKKHVEFLGVN